MSHEPDDCVGWFERAKIPYSSVVSRRISGNRAHNPPSAELRHRKMANGRCWVKWDRPVIKKLRYHQQATAVYWQLDLFEEDNAMTRELLEYNK